MEDDVLKTPLDSWGRAVIAGNLPYYITSPILEAVFRLESNWVRAVFLVQAEVATRIAAGPGSRDYGYLSVLAQSHARAEILFDVPRAAFHPPPKVDSAVVSWSRGMRRRISGLKTGLPSSSSRGRASGRSARRCATIFPRFMARNGWICCRRAGCGRSRWEFLNWSALHRLLKSDN